MISKLLITKQRVRYSAFILLFVASTLIGGCSKKIIPKTTPKPTLSPVPPITATISVVTDPSLEEITGGDPYAQISEHILEAYNPDRDLYNTLFYAIDNMEPSVDISGFSLSHYEKVATCDSLYEKVGFQFYYVDRIKVSKDGNSVSITYTDTSEEAKEYKNVFYSKLNHLVYNIAPEDYSPLQKLFSIYDYISIISDYTDNMQDSSTFTPYSILMEGKGICGGFAGLGYYVLNRVGIPTDYISNEPHAWNMVNLDGKTYHTDITWGVGSYGSNSNSLRTILMDDEQRTFTLENSGFGGYSIIKGVPRLNPTSPSPADNSDFKIYNDLYFEYALDIENNSIYYYDGEGIKKMSLAGRDLVIISTMPATYLTSFNGILYFINSENRHLYRLLPGNEAEVLDNTIKVDNIILKNGILYYEGFEETTRIHKSLNVNPFILSNFDRSKSNHQTSITLPLQQSFKLELNFSTTMATDVLPKEAVALVDNDGQLLPIHMFWSNDGRTLSIRSQLSLDTKKTVSLYVLPGITSANGDASKEMYDITVNIE